MKDKLVNLVTYRYDYRAEILKDKLEEEGIECVVTNASVFGQMTGFRVMVLEKDLEDAVKVYKYIQNLYDSHSAEVLEGPEE
ncbi:MAG: DUF2007 domain-containing protein [Bacteroidales bacterium]|jgi:cellobiose-specific phosphotransferase system component IIB|nr:DUF2007 domain-containing protein [Bacteroidales bacterium]MCK9500037.1 DUF2007 domain-containing protein [Bacteroidales bacterium]MDY0313596.1 DUF2007 domain-containing protein [Bacteroidales bacterium]NLB86925.1 DUF2007 domain-containing protein [Bacteroidales bacterium]NLB87062.1 DUF2007 domain-containing protein [Bacteroidales bacterium]